MDRDLQVKIQRCHPDAQLPTYVNPGDAGADLYAVEDRVIYPGQTLAISTGIKVAVPEGYELQIRPRSGISAKTFLRVANSPGTIDSGYRGEVKVLLHNAAFDLEMELDPIGLLIEQSEEEAEAVIDLSDNTQQRIFPMINLQVFEVTTISHQPHTYTLHKGERIAQVLLRLSKIRR
jgi:dUTP pyrophosphatase